jgi:lauroyl/myristoyl acyltransferase
VADEAALVERQFRPCPGATAGRSARPRLALRAYREYATYLVETMRLETQSGEAAAARVVQADLDYIAECWASSEGGLIFAVGHVGNNEAIAAAVADRGWPINVVADDSTFPEMFERFRRLREAWGIHVIPWRNLREIYKVSGIARCSPC